MISSRQEHGGGQNADPLAILRPLRRLRDVERANDLAGELPLGSLLVPGRVRIEGHTEDRC